MKKSLFIFISVFSLLLAACEKEALDQSDAIHLQKEIDTVTANSLTAQCNCEIKVNSLTNAREWFIVSPGPEPGCTDGTWVSIGCSWGNQTGVWYPFNCSIPSNTAIYLMLYSSNEPGACDGLNNENYCNPGSASVSVRCGGSNTVNINLRANIDNYCPPNNPWGRFKTDNTCKVFTLSPI